MNLEDLREKIDEVDTRIVELIVERIRIAEEIGRGKKAHKKLVEDIEREYKVLENVKSFARNKNINQGEVLTELNIRSIRPGLGLHPKLFNYVLGKKAIVDIPRGTPLDLNMVVK